MFSGQIYAAGKNLHDHHDKQDKVKYAVSEREDRFDNVNKDDWL